MMEDLNYHLQKRAKELGLDRADTLSQVQSYLETLYPKKCRAASLNDGVLRITTRQASVASELRFKQTDIKKHLETSNIKIKRLVIQIN